MNFLPDVSYVGSFNTVSIALKGAVHLPVSSIVEIRPSQFASADSTRRALTTISHIARQCRKASHKTNGPRTDRGTIGEYGALGGIRTHDLSLRRAALYPAELQAHKCGRIHVLNFTAINTNMVPRARVELARPCGHYALNVARLPFRHLGTRQQAVCKA